MSFQHDEKVNQVIVTRRLSGGQEGRVDITIQGQRREITFRVDRIRQEPAVQHEVHADQTVRTGTAIKVWWPVSACSILTESQRHFLQLADDYTFLNPHLTLCVDWFGGRTETQATNPGWSKWLPSEPTSPHWYGQEEFERLVSAYIAYDRDRGEDRSVRELVKEFRGLTHSAKQKAILDDTGLSRTTLSALCNGHGLQHDILDTLLNSIKVHSKPVKPSALGIIGRAHIQRRLESLGCEMESFQYRKTADLDQDGLPMVIETAFAWRGEECQEPRRLITGVNWSSGIVNPFRHLGPDSDGLDALLENRRAGQEEPIILFLHYAHPRPRYTNRGKSALIMSVNGDAITKNVESVTTKWTRQRKAEERQSRARSRRAALLRQRGPSIKDAAWSVMPEAYDKASDPGAVISDGRLPVTARNLYYGTRTQIMEMTGRDEIKSSYFTQTILPDYMVCNREMTATWDVTYDARGHFAEPHTEVITPLGTLDVRHYLADVLGHAIRPLETIQLLTRQFARFPTLGPEHRFGAVLFIEKEGFMPLFERVKLAERYDIAVMSTKGMPVVACRYLADELCGTRGIPLLILRDFDKSGFSIAGTLAGDRARYEYQHSFDVIDLGLRLEDVQEYNLESEPVRYKADPSDNLEKNGATPEEIEFLCDGWNSGQRVELNTFYSADLIR